MEISKRFSCLCFLLLSLFLLFCDTQASHQVFLDLQSLQSTPASTNQSYRTAYHFQPEKHWINDPNGPMYYNGIYHLFYQYNPYGSVWGNIVWAHSVSTDLINWTPLEPTIYPTDPFDSKGCWSGSATILPGNQPVILYTGIDGQNRQVQNIAVPKDSSDPLLRKWVKPKINPLMVPINGINSSSFRDPTTAWQGPDGRWRVVVGSKRRHRGMAILYRSKDFKYWFKAQHPLHSAKNTGMWECPDFYPVSVSGTSGIDGSVDGDFVKHVLKVSLDDKKFEYYTIGNYLHERDVFEPDDGSVDGAAGLRYDYGKFYASKTFYDSDKYRRVLWGWLNESDSVSDDVQKGWSGVQAIPRTVWLDSHGKQLVQWPIKEIETLRGQQVDLQNSELSSGQVMEISGIKATQADVEVSFELESLEQAEPFDQSWVDPQLLCSQKEASVKGGIGPFGLLVLASDNLDEYTAVFFRVFKNQNKNVVLMCSDQSRSSLRPEVDKTTYGAFVDVELQDGKIDLKSMIDHSIVESFGAGGRTCISARVYPNKAFEDKAHLHVFNYGAANVNVLKLSAWEMQKPRMN